MNSAQVIERTRAYIMENFLYTRPDVRVADDDSLLAQGIIDSMGVMELINFLQDSFGVAIDDEDITEENLGSLAAIAAYVTTKRAAPASASAA